MTACLALCVGLAAVAYFDFHDQAPNATKTNTMVSMAAAYSAASIIVVIKLVIEILQKFNDTLEAGPWQRFRLHLSYYIVTDSNIATL